MWYSRLIEHSITNHSIHSKDRITNPPWQCWSYLSTMAFCNHISSGVIPCPTSVFSYSSNRISFSFRELLLPKCWTASREHFTLFKARHVALDDPPVNHYPFGQMTGPNVGYMAPFNDQNTLSSF